MTLSNETAVRYVRVGGKVYTTTDDVRPPLVMVVAFYAPAAGLPGAES